MMLSTFIDGQQQLRQQPCRQRMPGRVSQNCRCHCRVALSAIRALPLLLSPVSWSLTSLFSTNMAISKRIFVSSLSSSS